MILKPPKGAMLNRGHPYARGLVGCWLMNEGGGNIVNDLSGNGNVGTIGANLAWGSGKHGHTVDWSGSDNDIDSDNVIDFPTITELPVTFTLAHWVKIPNTPWENQVSIAFVEEATNQTYIEKHYTATADGPTTHSWRVRNNYGTGLTLLSDNNCQTDVWEFVALTRDSSNVYRTFVNGIVQGDTGSSGVGVIDCSNLHQIGYSQNLAGSGKNFEGEISTFSIYNRALTASEIAQLYREPFCMFEVDL